MLIKSKEVITEEKEQITDGISYNFSVCEDCLSKWFKTFNIPPREEESDF